MLVYFTRCCVLALTSLRSFTDILSADLSDNRTTNWSLRAEHECVVCEDRILAVLNVILGLGGTIRDSRIKKVL